MRSRLSLTIFMYSVAQVNLFLYAIYTLLTMRKFGFFIVLEIETITACNRTCNYCPNSLYDRGALHNKQLMDIGLFHKIIDELALIGFSGMICPHFYGEPLCDDRLYELVVYAREKVPQAQVVIFSNGDLLTYEIYEQFTNQGVFFKIANHNPAVFEKTDQLQSLYQQKYGRKIANVIKNDIQHESLLNGRSGNIKIAGEKVKTRKCRMQLLSLVVNHKGQVLLCCNDYFSSVVMGDLNTHSIIQIWNDPVYKKLRKDISHGKFENELCRQCHWIVRNN